MNPNEPTAGCAKTALAAQGEGFRTHLDVRAARNEPTAGRVDLRLRITAAAQQVKRAEQKQADDGGPAHGMSPPRLHHFCADDGRLELISFLSSRRSREEMVSSGGAASGVAPVTFSGSVPAIRRRTSSTRGLALCLVPSTSSLDSGLRPML